MPTITITLANSTIVNGSRELNISDAALQDLLNWSVADLPQTSVPPSNGEALVAWVLWMMAETKQRVNQHKRRVAAQSAADGVAAIDIS